MTENRFCVCGADLTGTGRQFCIACYEEMVRSDEITTGKKTTKFRVNGNLEGEWCGPEGTLYRICPDRNCLTIMKSVISKAEKISGGEFKVVFLVPGAKNRFELYGIAWPYGKKHATLCDNSCYLIERKHTQKRQGPAMPPSGVNRPDQKQNLFDF